MYNNAGSVPMQNQGNPNMNPKFMMPSQPPQNLMMFNSGMNRVGMLPKPELPLHLQVLFAPRMPLVYVKPPEKHKCRSFDPIIKPNFDILAKFEDEEPPEKIFIESKAEQKSKMLKQKIEDHKNKIKEALKQWNPSEDPKNTGDPMKTLFVARISYETSEKKLRKEFEVYGPIKKIRLIKNITNNKPRGYAFIEFEHKKDFITAYKQADGKKIDERRVLVDCERGRTVKGWRPRRFAGGKGETRRTRSLHKERTAGTEKKKSGSKSRDNKKKRSRSDSRLRSRSRERSRDKRRENNNTLRGLDRDRDREREKDRNNRERERKDNNMKEKKYDYEREKKDREKKKEKNEKNEKDIKKEKKENVFKMEDEGELISVDADRKKKKKKGKDKDRSREKKRSKSPKDREKKQKKSKDKKIEKDDGKTTKFESYDMIQLNPILEKKESGLES